MKKEEDTTLRIKEENLRDGYEREKQSEMDDERESCEKKRGRETEREELSTGNSSKEVNKAAWGLHSYYNNTFYI